jgi:SAM-dependent methyltransferase
MESTAVAVRDWSEAALSSASRGSDDDDLVRRLLERFGQGPGAPGLGNRIVNLGCGQGSLCFRLADRVPEASLLGLEESADLLRVAESRRRIDAGWRQAVSFRRIQLPIADLAEGAFPTGFSTVVSQYLLHRLADPLLLWRTIRQLGAPGALVLVRDLARPRDRSHAEALIAQFGHALSEGERLELATSLATAPDAAELGRQLDQAGLPQLQVQQPDALHLEVSGRLP